MDSGRLRKQSFRLGFDIFFNHPYINIGVTYPIKDKKRQNGLRLKSKKTNENSLFYKEIVMKKVILTAFVLLIFGLFLNVVNAEDIVPVPNQAVENANNATVNESTIKSIDIASRDFDSRVPFIFQHDHKACIDQCSQNHTTCMTSVGENATAANNCDEKRWRCTLSCDNKFYGSHTF